MRKARLALWAAGAALLAAWLSSAAGTMPGRGSSPPSAGGPAPPSQAAMARQAAAPPAERIDLDREVARMAAYLERAPRPRPSVRNPFTLAPERPAAGVAGERATVPDGWAPSPASAAGDAPLRVSLAGIATDETPSGPHRTAILSVEGRVVLAEVGDEVPGRYQVRRIDDDGVELFDPGRQASFRLTLP